MAIACLRLVTFLPLRPLFSLPCFISCISRSTFLPAEGLYLRVDFFEPFFEAAFLVEDFLVLFLLEVFFEEDFLLAFLVAITILPTKLRGSVASLSCIEKRRSSQCGLRRRLHTTSPARNNNAAAANRRISIARSRDDVRSRESSCHADFTRERSSASPGIVIALRSSVGIDPKIRSGSGRPPS